MNKKVIFVVLIIAVIAIAYVFLSQSSQQERIVDNSLVENDVYSLSFSYLSGEDGYELISSATSDDFLQSYVLVGKTELVEYQSNEENLAPPTISIFVFQLPEVEETEEEQPGRITRLQTWAQDNQGITAFDRVYGTPEIVELDGVKGLEYTTDGTYQQSVFLASYRGFIYMFVGQYDRPTDFIKKDFETLLQSVRFE